MDTFVLIFFCTKHLIESGKYNSEIAWQNFLALSISWKYEKIK